MERYFYHSFPRRGEKLGDARVRGLRILESLARNGLLLVPEVVTWKDPLQPGSEPLTAYQRRICFTELSPPELVAHSTVFGAFAIEYSIDVLRKIGALPVVYVPDGGAVGGLESVGTALLANIAGAISLLRLASEAASVSGDVITFNLKMRTGEELKSAFSPQETSGVRKLIALLEKAEGMQMRQVSNALGVMASLFYPTENADFTGQLGYYRQREWRIVSGPKLGAIESSVFATRDQQKQMEDLDPDFFGRKIEFSDGTSTIAAKSHFMSQALGQHVLSLARRIIVPRGEEDAAKAILRANGLNVAVVSESTI